MEENFVQLGDAMEQSVKFVKHVIQKEQSH